MLVVFYIMYKTKTLVIYRFLNPKISIKMTKTSWVVAQFNKIPRDLQIIPIWRKNYATIMR